MIYDCFTFFKELDLLELRLNELNDIVDRWVIVEMAYTHTGKPKAFYFDRNRHRFRKWLTRIEHVKVYDAPQSLDPFQRERHQRNAIQRGLRCPQDNDLISIGDADEIPRPNAYEHFRRAHAHTGIASLNSRLYHYWLNGLVNEPWLMPKIMTGWQYKRSVPEELRYFHYHDNPVPVIQDSAWHFSWLGGVSSCVAKINAVAPVIFPGASDIRDELLRNMLPNPMDPSGLRKVTPIIVDPGDTASWPAYMLKNLDRYQKKGYIGQLLTGEPGIKTLDTIAKQDAQEIPTSRSETEDGRSVGDESLSG